MTGQSALDGLARTSTSVSVAKRFVVVFGRFRDGQVRPVLADPLVDVFDPPDLAHGKGVERLRPVRFGGELLDALPGDAETVGYLGLSHQVSSHERQHAAQTSRHLTSGARGGTLRLVTYQVV